MSSLIGKEVGNYTIVGKLGAGGMGEVYRATDSRLRRDVALKVLPEAFTSDTERMARFEREAQVLASLNHPNIGAIYGVEESDGVHCLVLELIEGETLGERIARGPLPVEEALELAHQMAVALEAAHERGVIHRDLKPANVKLTPDGTLKILDFGLAKAGAGADGLPSDISASPTLTVAATEAGMILGTAAYMSPEQAAGKPVDRRADIWAFGVVLVEMLTGQRLYAADSVPETLASVIAREPDLDRLPADLPPRIRRLLERCLRKDPRSRLRDVGDARIVIEEQQTGVPEHGSGLQAAPPPAERSVWRWVAGAAALAIAAATLAWSLKPGPREPNPVRFGFEVSEGLSRSIAPAFSPDGSRLVYRGEGRLWVRRLDRLDPVELVRTDAPRSPFWSWDGNWIAYGRGTELWKVPAAGGQPVFIASLESTYAAGSGGAWLENGRIVFATGNDGIQSVSDRGGELTTLLEPADGEIDFHDVSALPDGRGILFVVHDDVAFDTIAVLADGRRTDVLTLEGQLIDDPAYSDGHLIFGKRGGSVSGIFAVRFSLARLETTGPPFLVAAAGDEPGVSSGGLLAYVANPSDVAMELAILNRQGVIERSIEIEGRPDSNPSFSPDGRRVAVVVTSQEERQVWVHDLDRGSNTRVTSEPGSTGLPLWRGVDEMVYSRGNPNAPECALTAADGSGTPTKVADRFCWDVSADGRMVTYTTGLIGGDIEHGTLGGATEPLPFVSGEATLAAPRFSPDGRFLVYQSDESGRDEIYIKEFPGGAGRWQVSTNGGNWPHWRRNEVFYVHDGGLWSVEVDLTDGLTLGVPERLFDMPSTLGAGFNNWPDAFDASSDGQRFLMRRPAGTEIPHRSIVVAQNWLAEFRD